VTERQSRSTTAVLHVLQETVRALMHMRSEASTDVLAAQVVRRYSTLEPTLRPQFFAFLGEELAAPSDRISGAIERFVVEPSDIHAVALANAAASPRRAFFEAVCAVPDGVGTILDMRADVLGALDDHPSLAGVEADLFAVLSSWFNRGFLALERISWQSPAEVLEKLIAYEAVHEIRGWDDLRRRLEDDRRCFGLFHPVMPHEPLIFVEVAFVGELPSQVGPILSLESAVGDAKRARCAVFYSITSCQPGLTGISFGSFLIKRVMTQLGAELPSLSQFVTLSPIPGFRRWLQAECADPGSSLTATERRAVELGLRPGWSDDPVLTEPARPVLMGLCARYLATAKRGVEPRDSVARFHLRNGARIERINWLGDISPKGMGESLGMLVNYAYVEADITANHEAYVHEGAVARAPAIDALLAGDGSAASNGAVHIDG
jgi:malonyl-CoA decarboxylase